MFRVIMPPVDDVDFILHRTFSVAVFRRIFDVSSINILCLVKMADVEFKEFVSEVKSRDIAIKAEQTSDVSG